MNSRPDDLTRSERAALRLLREKVRQQQRAARTNSKQPVPPTPVAKKEPAA